MTFNIFPALGLLVVAGLDYRFGWSPELDAWLQAAALVLPILGNALFTWAMIANPFFSPGVRIQSDRGHKTATGGPYRYIRHPGYAGFSVFNLVTPLVLGSLWASIPGAILAVLFIIRTALEDATLQKELEGYKEYAERLSIG
ncbi:MAG: isoprenylcysteine carboxylmethyltransferase family protein [Firmicutes bacterium]|nr:isoprenylcysteine carboxylmethyltransferase family protein [Bacillota bacterium]